jgi:hypothetical protein
MNTEVEVVTPEEPITEEPMSREDKFFGISTTIDEETVVDKPIEEYVEEVPEDKADDKAEEVAEEKAEPKADPELEDYGEKVQKRIKKMTWQVNEQKRRAEAAEQMRDESVKVAQNLQARNAQYQEIITTGEARLVQEIKARAAASVARAQQEYAAAYESGDTDRVMAAQSAMINASAEQREAHNYELDYGRRMQQQQRAQQQWAQQQRHQPQPQPQAAVPPPSQEAEEWVEQNPWFGKSKKMTALAYGVHEELVTEEGLVPDTPEYFEALTAAMHESFPTYFKDAKGQGQPTSSPKKPSTVVAPGNRNNGSKPRQLKLNATQVSLAKKLGITPEQYAAEHIKLNRK